MKLKNKSNQPSSSIESLRLLTPTVAAIIACLAATPTTNLVADVWFGLNRIEAENKDSLEVEPISLRNEPIRPVPTAKDLDADMVALGRALFHEPGLSKSATIACATCHNIENGGDDGLRVSKGINGQLGSINAPTVLNASLNFRQFWDGRAKTLEEQVPGPIHNPLEMGADWNHVIGFLKQSPDYQDWFNGVFNDGVTPENVVDAIAEYERSLVTPDSPFDCWLKGDDQSLTELQKRGYQLFKENQCIGCHQGVNVGGNLYEPLGVMVDYFEDTEESEQHLGRYVHTGDAKDKHVFKVPSLRNVARTAPYFHDGSAPDLETAVRIMLTHQVGMPKDYDTVKAIAAFLESLSAEPEAGAIK